MPPVEQPRPDDIVLEFLPDHVIATLQVRNAWFKRLPPSDSGEEFVVADLQRWTPGQVVRVAFLGGTTALHKEIAEATKQITDACNLKLDFGLDPASGAYRTWSTEDTALRAEIRVSFDQTGYFSLVGTDSIDGNVGNPAAPVGGRPNQRSLNLGGFQVQKPARWQGTVRHEFLHALAFHHEHQNMRGPCEADFRWDDDPEYEPTQDDRGAYLSDSAGRRPGIYTYLAGFPNFWSKQRIDFNLRTRENPELFAGVFDPSSVMLYRFPPLFYKTATSACAPVGDGTDLSAGDRLGLDTLYPGNGAEAFKAIVAHRQDLLETVSGSNLETGGLEGQGSPASSFARQAIATLRNSLTHL